MTATDALLALRESECALDANIVLSCVKDGADVSALHSSKMPILHWYIREGAVQCVQACLTTQLNVDFRVSFRRRKSPFHLLCEVTPVNVAVEILALLVQRIKTHVGDKLSLSLIDCNGYDFLSCAAHFGKLSDFWPLVRGLVFYMSAAKPIAIKSKAFLWDWRKLGDQQRCFDLKLGTVDSSEALNILSSSDDPPLDYISLCIQSNADVCYRFSGQFFPSLHQFIYVGCVEGVKLCFTTKANIDFTVKDADERTPFHVLCEHSADQGTLKLLLEAIVERILAHPSDIVDLEAKDKKGNNFLACAALHSVYSICCTTLQRLPDFTPSPPLYV